jgi:GTP-binding protein Era
MIFLDTPGIHKHAGEQFGSQKVYEIHERINSEAYASLRDADIVIRLLDPTREYGVEDERIDELLGNIPLPVIRVETKQDLDTKSYPQKGVDIRVDSVSHAGFDELLGKIQTFLPDGPFLYDPDYYTDQSMDLRIGEVIRETLFQELGEEIPYACYVEVEQIENEDPALMKIQAYVNVEADSQKVIVIGKQGKKIQAIGTKSRIILEEIFGKKIYLALRVKVDKNWRKNQRVLDRIFPKK